MKKAVAYIRVSVEREDSSIHSVETQKSIIESYARRNAIEVVKWFIETNVSGGKDNRIELEKAVSIAKRRKYYVIVKDLSRLSRNASKCLQLLEDLNVIDCTLGIDADEKVKMMMALMSDWERKACSVRQLQLYQYLRKTQPNRVFGHKESLVKGRQTSMKNRKSRADKFALKLAPLVMNDDTLRDVCANLMDLGIKTARGGDMWKPTMVMRLRERIRKIG